MTGYTKLFSDIVTSTIWQTPNDQRVLWITLLALKGEDNICRATVPALAKMCDLTLENCEKYLALFQQPDKYSRSQEHEGRRIREVDGGWFIINGEKYQHLLSKEERKEYNRQKQARFRERHRERDQKKPALPKVTNSSPSSPSPSPSQDSSPEGERENARASDDEDIIGTVTPQPLPGQRPSLLSQAPIDLASDLREAWGRIAKDFGPEVATKARDAARRIFGSVSPKQLEQTHSCAHRRDCTHLPAEHWPDFSQQIRNDRAGITPVTQSPVDPERAAQVKRRMEEIASGQG